MQGYAFPFSLCPFESSVSPSIQMLWVVIQSEPEFKKLHREPRQFYHLCDAAHGQVSSWFPQGHAKTQTKPKLLGKRGCTSVRRLFRWSFSLHLTIFQKASNAHHYRILSNVQMQISPRSKFCKASSVASGGHAYRVKRSWQGWVRNDFKISRWKRPFVKDNMPALKHVVWKQSKPKGRFQHVSATYCQNFSLKAAFQMYMLELSWWILMAYGLNVFFVAAILLTCKSQRRRSSLACQSQEHVRRPKARTWIKLK